MQFHHALGLTEGVRVFADLLRAADHKVHVPDLFDGQRFDDPQLAQTFVHRLGIGTLLDRARAVAEPLPNSLVYAGCSLGVLPAQQLAQSRPGAAGALLFHGCVTPGDLGSDGWPQDVPVQIHGGDRDPLFMDEGDVDVARELVATASAELFLYPTDSHLFTDTTLPEFEPDLMDLVVERVLTFLAAIDDQVVVGP